MDVRILFRGISKKMLEDFKLSSQIMHNGSKGTVRENKLKEFLSIERMPIKYGVGSGEIIGRKRNTSRQCDLIIYDQFEGISLPYDKVIQVYPIECVYGAIEVKSHLSKFEFIMGLDNIKSIKSLAPEEEYVIRGAPTSTSRYLRPSPFGIIFAYALADNSVNSLMNNLSEWEKNNDPKVWPNLVVILGEGIIYHTNRGLSECFSNEKITSNVIPINKMVKDDTLFYFYSILLNLCSQTYLGPINIYKYLDPPEQIGEYWVRNHNRIVIEKDNGEGKSVYQYKEQFIDKVARWCQDKGSLLQKEVLLKQMGTIPKGMDGETLNRKVYLYDPENLPGIHMVDEPFATDPHGITVQTTRMQTPGYYIEIDGEIYYFSGAYVTENDIEIINGKNIEDL